MTTTTIALNTKSGWVERYVTGWPGAIMIVAIYWLMATSGWQGKCATFDERENITSGLGFWRYGDARLLVDDCILPRILSALPIHFLMHPNYPAENSDEWQLAWTQKLSQETFYNLGNDTTRMLYLARASMAFVTAMTGLIIYWWARRLFGRVGATISVVLFAFCPLILSVGALAVSDVLGTFFFTASLAALWFMLQRITWWSVLLSAFAVGLFFISKLTAVTIVPIGLLMAGLRLWRGPAMRVEWGRVWTIASRWKQAGVCVVLLLIHVVVAEAIIWRVYDFRFDPFTPHALAFDPAGLTKFYDGMWSATMPKQGFSRGLIENFRYYHLLPDRYLLGMASMVGTVDYHPAFANGAYSNDGFWWFFPYALWVKTPLGLFLILLLAGLAAMHGWKKRSMEARTSKPWNDFIGYAYEFTPLWIALVVYWFVAMRSHLNIGVRHLLPTFPIMYILAGGAGQWITLRRWLCVGVLGLALAWFVGASLYIRPNYLSYFNETVGGSAYGYRHLVDSSLDWGQDLPALQDYLKKNDLNDQTRIPVYLCYFGVGNARYYGIKNAIILPGFMQQPEEDPRLIPPRPGVYCISATMLSGVYTTPGGWNSEYERRYTETANFLQHPEVLEKYAPAQRQQMNATLVREMRTLWLGRMLAYLRHREPDAEVNDTILVFKLSDADIQQALGGPPAEMLDTNALLAGPPG